MFGNVRPVVFPADDDVALGGVVAVVAEVFALEFEFNMDMLPLAGAQSVSSPSAPIQPAYCLHGVARVVDGRSSWNGLSGPLIKGTSPR